MSRSSIFPFNIFKSRIVSLAGILILSIFAIPLNLIAEKESGSEDFKIVCNPPAGAARALEAYAEKVLTDKGAGSVKVSVKIKSRAPKLVNINELPAALLSPSNDSLSFKAAPSSILPDGAVGVSCKGEYEAVITASGIINNKVIKSQKSTVMVSF